MKIYNVLEVKSYGCSGDHASVYSKVFKTEAAAKKCLKERAAELDYSILEKIDTYEWLDYQEDTDTYLELEVLEVEE